MKAWDKVFKKPRHCEGTKCPKQSRYILAVIILAVVIKLSLFTFAAIHAPQGKLLPDSHGYLKLSDMLVSKGIFAIQNESGTLTYDTWRTPGYPLFLFVFHGLTKIPLDGIILIQIAMTLLAAFITYKTALLIETKIAFLSAVIIIFDPPIAIFSLTILTESLFLLAISLFMFNLIMYLKNENVTHLILSALILAVSAYIRPISYYLGSAVALFIIYANGKKNFRKALAHAIIFGLIVYSLLGIWQIRNYIRCGDFAFSSVEQANLSYNGLFGSYTRNTDIHTKTMAPVPYYISVSFRSLMSLMTRPGNFKYFGSEPLNLGSFVFSYPWMVFWFLGLILGVVKMGRNIYLQMMLFVMLYFIATSVGGLMWGVSERLRVPIMPFIAIISAYGWTSLRGLLSRPKQSQKESHE